MTTAEIIWMCGMALGMLIFVACFTVLHFGFWK